MYLKTDATSIHALHLAGSTDRGLSAYVQNNVELILHEWEVKSFDSETNPIDIALAKMAMRRILHAFTSKAESTRLSGTEIVPERAIEWMSTLRQVTIQLWSSTRTSSSSQEMLLVAEFHEYIDRCILGAFTAWRQRREEQMEHARGLIGHDLMTPISAMMLSAQCFQMAGHDNLAKHNAVEAIVRSGNLVSRIAKEASDLLSCDAQLEVRNAIGPCALNLESQGRSFS